MSFTTRPVFMGRHGVVTAGHYLAAAAGSRMLERGGNAIDAGVAAGLALKRTRAAVERNRRRGADPDL